mgnify:CR=1 FL=1
MNKSAPKLIKLFAKSALPFKQATCSGLLPSLFVIVKSTWFREDFSLLYEKLTLSNFISPEILFIEWNVYLFIILKN